MRVLFFADAVFEDITGGAQVVARELAHGLARRGHDVTFLVPRHQPQSPADERREGVRIVRYPIDGAVTSFVRSGQAACRRLWAEQPFDLVHTHFAYAAFGPLRAIPQHVPQVRTFYGPWDEEGWVSDTAENTKGTVGHFAAVIRKHVRYQFEALNLRRSDRVTVLSDSSRKYLMEHFGVPEQQIRLIPGGVDTDRFAPTMDKAAVQQSLGLPPHRRIMLSIRRLVPRMGLDNLLRAMPAIIAQHPDALLLIGGEGPKRHSLELMIERMHLHNHVRLLGYVPEASLASYYQAADLFVLPTVALEGFGLVTLEALASGVPVIGTGVGATPEILTNLEPRLITPSATAEGIAQSVCEFWAGCWHQALTPAVLHAYAGRNFNWAVHVQQTEAIYKEILAWDLTRRPINVSDSLPRLAGEERLPVAGSEAR